MIDHIVNQIYKPELTEDNILHVVRVISNPVRYHSRYRLARQQEEFLKTCPYIKVYTVEASFGKRQPEIVEKLNDNHLLVRINSEIWIKENMINLGVRHLLPSDWKYLAWVDADVSWPDKYWGLEALHKLQEFPVIQPWTDGLNLGPHGNVLSHTKSFGAQNYVEFDHRLANDMAKKKPKPIVGPIPRSALPSCDYRKFGHTGYAWACTRFFWENVGGLIDFCILGSADHNMALAMIGEVDWSINGGMQQGFFDMCHDWQMSALRVTHKQVGATKDRLEHWFHGPMKRRYYTERWKILVHFKFDPKKDLMYDDQGVVKLVGKPDLEHAIRHYNRSRCEDEISET